MSIKNEISVGFKVLRTFGDDIESNNVTLTAGDNEHNTFGDTLLRRQMTVDGGKTSKIFGLSVIAVIRSTTVLLGVAFNKSEDEHNVSSNDTVTDGSKESKKDGEEEHIFKKFIANEGGKVDNRYGDVDKVFTSDAFIGLNEDAIELTKDSGASSGCLRPPYEIALGTDVYLEDGIISVVLIQLKP